MNHKTSMQNVKANTKEKGLSGSDDSVSMPLWQCVPLSDYHVPTPPAEKVAVGLWSSIRQMFRRRDAVGIELKKEQELHALPEVRLAHLVPSLPWQDAAAALDTTLQDWLEPGMSDKSVNFFIGQPFSSHAEIVALLGRQHGAVEIAPPSSEQVLSADESWLDHWPSPQTFWVLPQLERCFLRHANGLGLARRLMSLAANGQLGKGLIGCDSWAWAYLQRIFPWPRAQAVTLQAFDAERLQRLLVGLMKMQTKKALHCRSAKNGQPITDNASEGEPPPKEFAELAAHCRGNVAIATTYWRERLRHQPDKDESSDHQESQQDTDESESVEQVWVAGMPPDPELPLGNDEEFFLLLHAILLHGGLPESLLGALLPFSSARCLGLLAQLQQAGIVLCINGRWQVRETAYATVRQLLTGRDYLVDAF